MIDGSGPNSDWIGCVSMGLDNASWYLFDAILSRLISFHGRTET